MVCALREANGAGPIAREIVSIARCNEMHLCELLDHIIAAHHEHLCRALPVLFDAFECAKDEPRKPVWLNDVAPLLERLAQCTRDHMAHVEQILVPLIRELHAADHRPGCYPGGLSNCAQAITACHKNVRGLLTRLRQATGNFSVPHTAGPATIALIRGLKDLEFEQQSHAAKELVALLPRALAAEQLLLNAPHRVARRVVRLDEITM